MFSKKPATTSSDLFEKLLFWKKEFNKIIAELDNEESEISQEELFLRKQQIEDELEKAEFSMINTEKGLYLGIGYPLGDEVSPEPRPIYAKWSNLHNHLGVKGTTRVGKSKMMLGHIDQVIAKGWDVIIIDPKGGQEQEVLSSTAQSCFTHDRVDEMMYFSPAFEELSQKINAIYGQTNQEITSGIIEAISEPNMEEYYLIVGSRILLAITTSFEYLQAVTDPSGEFTRWLEEEEIYKYQEFMNSTANDKYNLKNKDLIDKLHTTDSTDKELNELKDIGFNRTLITYRDIEIFCSFQGLTNLLKIIEAIPLSKSELYSELKISNLKDEALRILKSALHSDEKHFAKVSDTLAVNLIQLSTGPVGELLCGTRINPLMNRLLRKDKGVVAVIQPFPMKFKKAATAFNKMLLGMVDSMMGTVGAEGRSLPRRLAIFIDEAGAIAYPGIQNFFNRAGGLGVTVFVYTQSDEDYIEAVGEPIGNVILDNINTPITMRQNLLKSCINAADDIGTIATQKTIAMISAGGAEGRYTTDTQEEYLCKPDDIKKLPVAEGILRHDGEIFYMEFPYKASPKGSFKMPELKSERSKKYLANFEYELEKLSIASNSSSMKGLDYV